MLEVTLIKMNLIVSIFHNDLSRIAPFPIVGHCPRIRELERATLLPPWQLLTACSRVRSEMVPLATKT